MLVLEIAAIFENNCQLTLLPGSPRLPEEDAEQEEARMFQLGLEEAYFLAFEVSCMSICRHTPEVCGSSLQCCFVFSPPLLSVQIIH